MTRQDGDVREHFSPNDGRGEAEALPLDLRVFELGSGPASAFCAKLLNRWGAEVISVADPSRPGDFGDPALAMSLGIYLQGGKKRLAINYRTTAGHALLTRVAAQCDVLITDLPAREVHELGILELGNASRPTIRASITPFGLDGPYRDFEATPATLLALGGYTYLMGDPGRARLTMPGHYPEYQPALFAFSAILAVHLSRPTTPQRVEVSVMEALAALHQYTTVQYTYTGSIRRRHGNRWGTIHPLTILPCRDGWFGMSVTANFWEPFTKLLGHEELSGDPRFATPAARVEHADELDAIIVEAVSGYTKRDLMEQGQKKWRVPMGIVGDLGEMLADPHLQARGFWQQVEREDGEQIRLPAMPFRFAGEPPPSESAGGERLQEIAPTLAALLTELQSRSEPVPTGV
jgi:crotonobetainyl-CoA:carnitine CoA-transferase CaiB-like acyl-CoA transferase